MPASQEPEQLLNTQQVSELLGVGPQTVYRLADAGVLPVVRLGRWIRFAPSALRRFQDSGGVTVEERAQAVLQK